MRRAIQDFSQALVLLAAPAVVGCAAGRPQAAQIPSPAAVHTYIVELPGMGGWTFIDVDCLRGFSDAGVTDRIEIYDWTTPNTLVGAICAQDHNRKAAQYVADCIVKKSHDDPSAKIVLVAWSAGSAIALWTLEDLPADVKIQSVLMYEPAVNPQHDLRDALSHVRGHLNVVESAGDFVILGLGTWFVGTADGNIHTPSAGWTGFRRPAGVDAMAYQKLVEIPWQPRYLAYGDIGGHITPLSRSLAREVLAPIVESDVAGPGNVGQKQTTSVELRFPD